MGVGAFEKSFCMISLFLVASLLLCVLTNAFSDKKIKENIVNSMYVKDLENFTCTNESLYINKNEIFKYYTTTVLYGYDDYLSVYRDIYDKKISLAKLFENFDEARGDRFYGIEEFEISKYINPADRHKKWIAADQLVSIEDDLIPFLFNEEQILVKAIATKRTEWN